MQDGERAGSAAGVIEEQEVTACSAAARLKAAREGAGLSVKEIAGRTRITLRHVEALESGDYGALPGRPYALGFARAYARAVGLDHRAIEDQVRRELAARAPSTPARAIQQFEVGDPEKTPTRLLTWLAALLAIGVMALGAVFWRSYYFPSAELPAIPSPAPPLQVAAAAQPVAPASAAPAGPVVFTALEDRIWVKFTDGNGVQLLQKQLARGESYTVPDAASGTTLWTGRPDALAITVGGKPVPRIAEVQRIVKGVPVSATALLARPAPTPAAAPPAAVPSPVSAGKAR